MAKIISTRVKNLTLTLGIMVILFLMLSCTASAAVADTWQSPLPSYTIGGYTFGQYVSDQYGKYYHAGEDLQATQYTPVTAMADGKVVWSKTATDFGWVVVIEHTLPDNSKVCSIYGHLSSQAKYPRPSVNSYVSRGQIIGYIGNDQENGAGGPHLHIQIMNGAGSYSWVYQARLSSATDLTNYKKPSDYLKLIRVVGTSNVYYIDSSNRKALVPTENVFKTHNWRWEDVRPVTSTELNRFATANPSVIVFPDGVFLKKSGGYEISLIRGGLRHPFASWDAYLRYGGKSDQSNVMTVTAYEYSLNALGNTYY